MCYILTVDLEHQFQGRLKLNMMRNVDKGRSKPEIFSTSFGKFVVEIHWITARHVMKQLQAWSKLRSRLPRSGTVKRHLFGERRHWMLMIGVAKIKRQTTKFEIRLRLLEIWEQNSEMPVRKTQSSRVSSNLFRGNDFGKRQSHYWTNE